jgi:DNA-directed RNA polymerase subunit RPC12/RpoP
MISLKCPSCGGHLDLPENLALAHCMYCGTRILLQESELPKERQNLDRFKELSKVALQAENFEEAVLYCNKILEIDPKDVDAWVDKAVSTFWLSSQS